MGSLSSRAGLPASHFEWHFSQECLPPQCAQSCFTVISPLLVAELSVVSRKACSGSSYMATHSGTKPPTASNDSTKLRTHGSAHIGAKGSADDVRRVRSGMCTDMDRQRNDVVPLCKCDTGFIDRGSLCAHEITTTWPVVLMHSEGTGCLLRGDVHSRAPCTRIWRGLVALCP
jgi:hypothetical protein